MSFLRQKSDSLTQPCYSVRGSTTLQANTFPFLLNLGLTHYLINWPIFLSTDFVKQNEIIYILYNIYTPRFTTSTILIRKDFYLGWTQSSQNTYFILITITLSKLYLLFVRVICDIKFVSLFLKYPDSLSLSYLFSESTLFIIVWRLILGWI